MPREDQLPEEETPVVPEEPVQEEPAEEEPVAAVPDESDQDVRAIASAEDQPQDEPQETRDRSAEEKPAKSRKKGRRPHPLWRGWWLAVVLLACFVLMGQPPSPGAAWVKQPMRAFAGAVFFGGCLASLPGFLRGSRMDKPAWKRCLLAVLAGLAWGVMA